MNISVINLKTIIIKFMQFIAFIIATLLIITILKNTIFADPIIDKFSKYNYSCILNAMLLTENKSSDVNFGKYVLSSQMLVTNIYQDNSIVIPDEGIINIQEEILITEIPKNVQTESVEEKNIVENFNKEFDSVKINNESDYEITPEMLTIDVNLTNHKDVFIYHTHTCESYTPTEQYNYTMTGNYRTTDNNYNVVRIGEELNRYLTKKGFNVVHNTTYHDYPSYSGSYSRSLETAQNSLYGTDTQIVFDLHRDAVGDGATYGPTVKVEGNKVAQLMFVIGTNGGGLEHENWIQNLKIAMEIQKKANEMYPRIV